MVDVFDDDLWLYGDNPDQPYVKLNEPPNNIENEEQPKDISVQPQEQKSEPVPKAVEDNGSPGVDDEQKENGLETNDEMEDGDVLQNKDDSEKSDLGDDSDDYVNVVIGDIKVTASSYTTLNIRRGGLLMSVGDKNKHVFQQKPETFVVEDFEQIGTINGVPAMDFDIDSLEDKPWRKPGSDISDYFNYGFNEDTWRAYCERQKRIRVYESGVGLIPMNDNSENAGSLIGMDTASPPPYRKFPGSIDIRGAVNRTLPPPTMKVGQIPKVNTIQVITADRREYSRKPARFHDMRVPPHARFKNYQPEYELNPEPEPFYGVYKPTQDYQWGTEPPNGWAPRHLKILTGPHPMFPPSVHMGSSSSSASRSPGSRRRRHSSPHKLRDREKNRDTKSRSKNQRDRDQERSHRRKRSRSRSRKHKYKSRSPSHRSHRKKKSRRHEESE